MSADSYALYRICPNISFFGWFQYQLIQVVKSCVTASHYVGCCPVEACCIFYFSQCVLKSSPHLTDITKCELVQ